jgi:hypothetical protein
MKSLSKSNSNGLFSSLLVFELDISTEPEEYITYTEPVLMQVAIHDRRRLVNPYAEGYSLKGGVQYEATISMVMLSFLLV